MASCLATAPRGPLEKKSSHGFCLHTFSFQSLHHSNPWPSSVPWAPPVCGAHVLLPSPLLSHSFCNTALPHARVGHSPGDVWWQLCRRASTGVSHATPPAKQGIRDLGSPQHHWSVWPLQTCLSDGTGLMQHLPRVPCVRLDTITLSSLSIRVVERNTPMAFHALPLHSEFLGVGFSSAGVYSNQWRGAVRKSHGKKGGKNQKIKVRFAAAYERTPQKCVNRAVAQQGFPVSKAYGNFVSRFISKQVSDPAVVLQHSQSHSGLWGSPHQGLSTAGTWHQAAALHSSSKTSATSLFQGFLLWCLWMKAYCEEELLIHTIWKHVTILNILVDEQSLFSER